ncbi:MAG: hypothetical protein CVU89_07955 [Firmicutes bacterium HGW-Firmicutes-14]|nr:MAG: hypothetical protein CVU89_07955 [Firmicutes bacterium HGW-Firmicutes-14]
MTENIKTGDVLEAWKEVVESGQPHSSVRLGDAQIIVAAHEEILSMKFVNKLCRWANDHLPDSKLPDKKLQEQLVWALHQADFLGVFCQTEHWNLKPLSDMVIQYYDIKPSRFFYAFDNFYISKDPRFYEYFKDTKVLLIGAKAGKLKEVLERRYGWTGIAGTVDCPNWKSFEKAMSEMDKYKYRLALVSAGVPGTILASYAKHTGHVGISFGSGADTCIQADADGVNTWEWDKNPVY